MGNEVLCRRRRPFCARAIFSARHAAVVRNLRRLAPQPLYEIEQSFNFLRGTLESVPISIALVRRTMNSDQVNGTIDEVVGSAKQKAGKLTDNTPLQVKGVAQQVKGKLENALGDVKDAVRGANQEA